MGKSLWRYIEMRKILAWFSIGVSLCLAQRLETTIRLPDSLAVIRNAQSLAYNSINDKIYISGTHSIDREGYILVIDRTGYEKIALIPIGIPSPYSLVWDSHDNKLYCANSESDSLIVIDGATDRVIARLKIGDEPYHMIWNSINNRIYCVNIGSRSDDIAVVDCFTDSIITHIEVEKTPSCLVWNRTDNKLYCANLGTRDISIIDCNDNRVIKTVSAGAGFDDRSHTFGVWDSINNKIYFILKDGIIVIDGKRDILSEKISTGERLNHLIWTKMENELYATSYNRVWVIDGISDTVRDTISIDNYSCALLWNPIDKKVYCAGEKNITVIDGKDHRIITTLPIEGVDNPYRLFWCSERNEILCAAGSMLTIVDGSKDTTLKEIPLCSVAGDLVWNSKDNKLYCANEMGRETIVIDGLTNKAIKRVPLKDSPSYLLWNATENKIYCSCKDRIEIIGANNDKLIKEILNASGPLLWNSQNNRVYCTISQDTVGIIDGKEDKILTKIPLIRSPSIFEWNATENKIYCGGEGYVAIILGKADTLLGYVEGWVGNLVISLFWNPLEDKLYCLSTGMYLNENIIAVVDGRTDKVLKRLSFDWYSFYLKGNLINNKIYCGEEETLIVIGSRRDTIVNRVSLSGLITEMLWDSTTNKLYCTHLPDSVTVLDGSSDNIITTIPIGHFPHKMAYNTYQHRLYVSNYWDNSISVIRDYTGIEEKREGLGSVVVGHSPNPVSGITYIKFYLESRQYVTLEIYNLLGELVKTLADGIKEQGIHNIEWRGEDSRGRRMPSGVYFYILKSRKLKAKGKLILLR